MLNDPRSDHSTSRQHMAKGRVSSAQYNVLGQDPNGQMWWDGLPYNGPAFDAREGDPENMQPQKRQKACVAILDLADETEGGDMDQYRGISQRVADGQAYISVEDQRFIEADGTWKVLLRWVELQYEAPEALTGKPAGSSTYVPAPAVVQTVPSQPITQQTPTSSEASNATTSRYTSVDHALIHAFGEAPCPFGDTEPEPLPVLAVDNEGAGTVQGI